METCLKHLKKYKGAIEDLVHRVNGCVRVAAWTYLFCSGGLVTVEERKVRRGRKAVGGGL